MVYGMLITAAAVLIGVIYLKITVPPIGWAIGGGIALIYFMGKRR